MPSDPGMGTSELAAVMVEQFPSDEFPHLAEFTFQHVMQPGYDYGDEFEYGLDLILEGLDTARASEIDATGAKRPGRRRG